MAVPLPRSDDGAAAPSSDRTRALVLTSPAPRRLRRDTAVMVALGTAFAVASVLLAVEQADSGDMTAVPVIFAALALLLGGAASVAGAWERGRRELPRRTVGMTLITVAALVIYGGQALAYALTISSTAPVGHWVDALPMALGVPVGAIGMVLVAWPPRMTRWDVTVTALDSIVAALCLAVIWLLAVGPVQNYGDDRLATVTNFTHPWSQYLAVVAVVVTASASRRSGALPIGQLVALQSAVLVYVAFDVAGHIFTNARGWDYTVSWSIVGFLGAAWLFRWFVLGPAVQPEGPSEAKLRSVWYVLIPFLPIPLAGAAALIYRVTVGPVSSPLLLLTLIMMVTVVGANGFLRLMISRDYRRLQATKMSSPLTGGAGVDWFEAVLGEARDVLTVVDRDGAIFYQTPSARALIGQPSGALTGKHIANLFPDLSRRQFMELLVRASHDDNDRGPYEMSLVDVAGRRHDTETIITPLSTGGIDGYVLTTNDVTDRRRLRAALVDSSVRDGLTGLPNREGFLTRVREVVPAADQETAAVMLFDINSFRDLNDSRGHNAGDQVLRVVAAALERLPEFVGAVGRTGADEFGVLVVADPIGPHVGDVERLLRSAVRSVLVDDGQVLAVDFALGYSVKHARTDTAGDLIERADLALATARSGRTPSAVAYRPEMRSALVARLRSEADLRDALDTDRLVVHYQPIVDLRDHRVYGVEALARLVTPSGEIVSPSAFIPHAEELGLIGQLGTRVLRIALRDSSRISASVGRSIPVSVNFSAIQVDESLPDVISDALRTAEVPADRLVLELTESILAERQDVCGAILGRIRRMGCRVALDDFGTGYSSLSYLAGLPVDLMKIDQSFVGRLGSSSDSFALVRTLLQLAQNLGLTTVAEGVETVEQADILRGMDCTRAQGFLFGRPVPLAELEEMLDFGGGVLPGATISRRAGDR